MNFDKWTNEDGEVLILRRINADRTSSSKRLENGKVVERLPFRWPTGVGTTVECADWNPNNKCGGGLHGWPWGVGLGDGCEYDIIGDIWLVLGAKPEDVAGDIDGGPKCKARRVTIRMEASFGDCMAKVRPGFDTCVLALSQESGYSSTAASSGYSSTAVQKGTAGIAASIGVNGTVTAGERGCIIACYWSKLEHRYRAVVGYIGEGGLQANKAYKLGENHEFTEA